jgi:hypothetical protein
MFQTKVIEKIKTHILLSVTLSEKHAVYVVVSQNLEQPERPKMAIDYGAGALHAG